MQAEHSFLFDAKNSLVMQRCLLRMWLVHFSFVRGLTHSPFLDEVSAKNLSFLTSRLLSVLDGFI